METYIENKNRKVALTITILFHALLIFIFISIVFIKPVRSFEMNDFALGMISDNSSFFTVNTVSPKASITNTSNDHKAEKIIIDPTETSNFISTSFAIKEHIDTSLQKALMKLHGVNKSKGINTGKFNEVTTTDLNSSTEIHESYILQKRLLLKKPERITDLGEEGTVVVDIIVNEFGNVINAIAGQRGSTTTSSALFAKAHQAAYEAKFNASPDGVKEQRGTYTFVFTLE